MIKKILVFALLFTSLNFQSQVIGKVIDGKSKEPISGVKVVSSDGTKLFSGADGQFVISPKTYPITLIISMIQFVTDTLTISGSGEVKIVMKEPVKDFQTVVISAGKRKQTVEEVPVSMEIIKPQLIDNKGITDLEQAVDQTPGVFTMDGQVSIRGGSGFAYGTGSRVLLLWNGMPLLSGYAGDTQWNAIPMEQASQIEVMKGASSVLYGSGALNGVIALSEKTPEPERETKIKVQYGFYDNPRRQSLKWWTRNPMNQQVEAYTSKMNQKYGYTISSTLFHNDGYRQGESEYRGRVSGSLYFRVKNNDRIKYGVGYNYQIQKTGNFLIWQSDSLGYIPSGGADTSNAESTLTYNLGQRLFIDPYFKFTDKNNNKHNLKARMYYAENKNLNNLSQSNGAVIYFTDYQFQKQFNNGVTLSSGVSNITNLVFSNLFGNHTSWNPAVYTQYEHKIGDKLDISAGVRVEYFEMDGKRGDSDFMINKKDSVSIPVYPILRTGVHYELAKYTHLRASIGQGIRYPSVAERFTQTSVGALNIFPNPGLTPEKGWAGEIGIKQGVKIGDWKGMLDVAAFVNQYSNMMEFTFIYFNPISQKPVDFINPTQDDIQFLTGGQYTLNDWVGFQAQNAERARITGIDFSFNSMGKIGNVEIISLLGYTYMNPISLSENSSYQNSFSDTNSNMLKYRFKHLAKADIEVNYKKMSFGVSCRYNSFMKNIDLVFEEDLDPAINSEVFILPGLKEYREKYNKGSLVIDFRLGYKFNEKIRLGLIANNLFNAEYSSRPGDIQPPRNFLMQLQMKL
jgi:outer membrane receptor protein involved in Fe transport